jgi:hyperosmotically inducible periplasmic protein
MKTRIQTLALSTALSGLLAISVVGCGKTSDGVGAPPPATSVGTDIDDSVITSSVKTALIADPDIKSFDFKVETRKGEVMLSGFVDNQAQLDRATAAASAVSGVKGVQNNVTLKGTPATAGNTLDDSVITGRVKAALLGDKSVKSFDISVATQKDAVQLSGFVNNQGQMDRAVEIARGVDGVRKVINEMSIKK